LVQVEAEAKQDKTKAEAKPSPFPVDGGWAPNNQHASYEEFGYKKSHIIFVLVSHY
jgi:hypothetical protein